ncbi:MAG TPA: formate dehydrogenase subunit gamma [Casimicrobiaceae bacterium]|jgi:formate dehydrogenase subunit gamma|nr:formate dehydrogenase subunit gamma [Casimicrobiaceae bacterium]
MASCIVHVARIVAIALCLAVATVAGAQPPGAAPQQPSTTTSSQPPVSQPQGTYGVEDEATAQQQQQMVQPLNNKPVWDIVRSGQPQFTSLPGRETNVLIQDTGQTWRALRNSDLSIWGGWALVLVLLAIAAFYFYRGPITTHAPPTGNLIRRFTLWERTIHWTTAICFVALAISGVIILFGKNLLLPLFGYTLFSWLAILSKNVHNFVGPVFVVCLFLIFSTFVRDNFWRRYDWTWLRHFGGMMSGREVPSHRFNAGEKLIFWFMVLLIGGVVAASGLVLDFPNFNQTRYTMQWANGIHITFATIMLILAFGHIYIGTIGMVGAYDAMRYGYVDETWAREHHEYWYNDVKAGRIPPSGDVIPPVARPA